MSPRSVCSFAPGFFPFPSLCHTHIHLRRTPPVRPPSGLEEETLVIVPPSSSPVLASVQNVSSSVAWLLLRLRSPSPGPAEQGSHELSVKPETGGHLASCYCSGPVLSTPSSYPPASCAPPASSNQPLSLSAWGRLDLISESPCPPPSD